MRKILLVHTLAALLMSTNAQAQVRSITPAPDELIEVTTALGLATLIYLPDALLPSIIGDQSAFRIDPIPNGVSIKPLRYGARTNLYLMTEKRRFNFRLLTAPSGKSDYVLYVKEPRPESTIQWMDVKRETSQESISIKITRIGISSQGFLLVDGSVETSPLMRFKPEDFWIMQEKTPVMVDSLFVSELETRRGRPVRFSFALNKLDLVSKKPIKLELRTSRPVSIQIPEGDLWR